MKTAESLEKLRQNYIRHLASADSGCEHKGECTFVWMSEAYLQGQRDAKQEMLDAECVWTLQCNANSDFIYTTQCSESFMFTTGNPQHNGINHCCYCGKKMVIKGEPE